MLQLVFLRNKRVAVLFSLAKTFANARTGHVSRHLSTLYGDKGFLDLSIAGVLNFAAIHSTLATLACYGTPDPSALCIESASGPFSRSEGVSKLVLTLA